MGARSHFSKKVKDFQKMSEVKMGRNKYEWDCLPAKRKFVLRQIDVKQISIKFFF